MSDYCVLLGLSDRIRSECGLADQILLHLFWLGIVENGHSVDAVMSQPSVGCMGKDPRSKYSGKLSSLPPSHFPRHPPTIASVASRAALHRTPPCPPTCQFPSRPRCTAVTTPSSSDAKGMNTTKQAGFTRVSPSTTDYSKPNACAIYADSTAIDMYSEALKLNPADRAPLHNISAAQFESGNYLGCIATLDSLSSSDGSGEEQQTPHKVLVRGLKSYFSLGKFQSAIKAADELLAAAAAGSDKVEIQGIRDAAARYQTLMAGVKKSPLGNCEIPLYRPQL